MKPTSTFIKSLGLIALGTCLAAAQEGAPKGPPQAEGGSRIGEFLKRADTDADGKISKEEFNNFSKRDTEDRFSKIDTNADGFVDQSEMGQIGERMREGATRRPGGEGEGMRRPGAEGGEGGFRRPPGQGTPEGSPRPEGGGDRPMPREGDRPQGGPPGGGQAGAGAMGMNPDEVYARMDKNSDGGVDKEEFAEFSKAEIETRFGRMDENKDGKVSKVEMKAATERLRSMMRGGQGSPPGQGGAPGGFRRPGAEGGAGGEGGFRRPPTEGGAGRPRPEAEGEAPKKDPA